MKPFDAAGAAPVLTIFSTGGAHYRKSTAQTFFQSAPRQKVLHKDSECKGGVFVAWGRNEHRVLFGWQTLLRGDGCSSWSKMNLRT